VSDPEPAVRWRRLRWHWPLVAITGVNAALVAVGFVMYRTPHYLRLPPHGRRVLPPGLEPRQELGRVLMVVAAAALLASLLVAALLVTHEISGARWALVAARVASGLLLSASLTLIGFFGVGLLVLPTGAALVMACVSRPTAFTGHWYPAVSG
jgi:hypothetical protein